MASGAQGKQHGKKGSGRELHFGFLVVGVWVGWKSEKSVLAIVLEVLDERGQSLIYTL
jgi:hypothetical protein